MDKWKNNVPNYFITRNTKKEWAIAIALLLLLIVFFVEYHVLRERPRFDLYTINKGIALGSSILIILSMIISPLAQLMNGFKSLISIRRPLGVVGAIGSVLHIILSLFFIPKFNMEWYLNSKNYATVIIGFIITAIFCLMWYYSYSSRVKEIGHKRTKSIHRLGYWGVLGIILHLLTLDKMSGCLKWFSVQNYIVPPGTLTIFVLGTLFFLVFLIAFFKHKLKNK